LSHVATQHTRRRQMQTIKMAQDLGFISSEAVGDSDIDAAYTSWQTDWCLFAKEALGINLDPEQQAILSSVQFNRRTTVRSGHARGKDYVAAVASVCFLYLNSPCKVVNTAPTGRQVNSIMMAEIRGLLRHSRVPMGGEVLQNKIRFDDPNWFMEGFKAADKNQEAWTGYHSPHLLVVVSEASGIDDETFSAIEGLLTGDSRLLIVGNPMHNSGEFYQSFRSPLYNKYILDCLSAPNVRANQILIPGQVDYQWVDDHVHKQGWTVRISEAEISEAEGDFFWEGDWYRPTDLFRSRVRGMFPQVDSDKLIPIGWVELAMDRWAKWKVGGALITGSLRLGVDVAGMGADCTCFASRHGDVVLPFEAFSKSDHMVTAGMVKNRLAQGGRAFVDTIGEGAGVFSRLREEKAAAISVKFSEQARNPRGISLHDKTGERCFVNMRAYCYWSMRDALDPQLGGTLMLPPDDELVQELTEIGYTVRGNGEFIMEPKDDIKLRLGRSPDRADALAQTYYPGGRSGMVTAASKYEWRG